jgi:hypothetical protein
MVHFEYAEIVMIGDPQLYSTDNDLLIRAAELIRKQGYDTELKKLPSGQLYRVKGTKKGFGFNIELNDIMVTLLLNLMLEDGWEPFAIRAHSGGLNFQATALRRAYTRL